MIVNELFVCTKWIQSQGINQPEAGEGVAGLIGWQDETGQPAENLLPSPNVYILRAWVDDALAQQIGESTKFLVLARRRYDTLDRDTLLFDNFDEQPTAQQLTALRDTLLARFPNLDDDALSTAGQLILRSGLRRVEIIRLLCQRWRLFLKAVT